MCVCAAFHERELNVSSRIRSAFDCIKSRYLKWFLETFPRVARFLISYMFPSELLYGVY